MTITRLYSCLLVAILGVTAASAATTNVYAGGNLQNAIDNASNGDVIIVGAGTYTSPFNFKGKSITVRSVTPTNATVVANTKLVGPGDAPVVMFNHGETTTSRLMGFTISGGRWDYGGGIICTSAGPTISDNNITQNHALHHGGGIAVIGTVPAVIVRNTIAGNVADEYGGGIYIGTTNTPSASPSHYGNLPMSTKTVDSTIADNTIADNHAKMGGGVLSYALEPLLDRDIIARNVAESAGGLMTFLYNPTLANCTIVGNQATKGMIPANGGAMVVYGGIPTITNCIIANNINGGIYSLSPENPPVIKYCDVYGNTLMDYVNFPASPTGTNGNISRPPSFADFAAGDYHLQSCNGRWNVVTQQWVKDQVTSPCLDAGDPASSSASEPQPNMGPIELGVYGNTGQASRSSMFASRAPYGHPIARRTTIEISFLKPVKHASAQSHFKLIPTGGSAVAGTFVWGATGCRFTFTPTAPLLALTHYVATCSTGIVRTDGSTINWAENTEFTTGGEPVVATATPTGIGVSRAASIAVTFDQAMARPTAQSAFSSYPAVAGSFTWVGNKMAFKPTSLLDAMSTYEITINKNAKSLAGLTLGKPYKWSFKTGKSTLPVSQVTACAAGSGAQLTISLSDAALVGTSICNLAGREIAIIPEQSLPQGLSTLLWSGKSKSGTAVPAGQYWVRVSVREADGSQKQTVAPLQLR